MRVADYIVSKIYNSGADTIFSVSGRGALFLTDAVAKHGVIKNVAVHHEQSASYAAAAYAQYSGKLGACMVSTGCASTNAMTGVLTAWQDGLPCIFISGQNILNETSNHTKLNIRTYGQQEANIIPMVQSITKYATMLTKADDIVDVMNKAIYSALEGRQGPVWIDVPLDLQSTIIQVPDGDLDKLPAYSAGAEISPTELSGIIEDLSKAKRPILLIGSGVRSAGAEELLIQFAEQHKIPVVYSNSAPDIYGSRNLYSVGSIGAMGATRAGNFALQNSDLVIVLGNRLSTYSTGVDFCKFAREAKVIVVDIDRDEHKKESIEIHTFIHCDVKSVLSELLSSDFKLEIEEWTKKCIHWKELFGSIEKEFSNSEKIDLYELTSQLSSILPENASLVTDSGFIEVILPTNLKFGNDQRAIHPVSQGAMGFALPGAIGAYFASKKPVLVVVGDGSVMMNLQELETIRGNKIPAKIIIINNNVYGIIRRRQVDLFRRRTIGTDPSNGVTVPDFEKVAYAFGIKYQKIETKQELEKGLVDLVSSEGPTICEIICREDQSYIEVSTTKDMNKKLVRRPLEDQIPFLNRDLFLSEMIITPIDQ